MRILLLQRGSSYMIDHTLGDANNSTSAGTESPTKVDLFHVGKEASVQSSRFAIVRQTDEHGGTGSPEYRQYGVILPSVRFDYSHHPSPTKRISVAVDESAGSSGIFEPFFLSPTAYLRLAGSHLRMGVHIGSHRLQPLSGHLDIGIEQHHILGLHLPEGKIIPICKTMIPIQQNPAYRGKLAAQHLHRLIRRTVISHTDFHTFSLRISKHGGKKRTEHLATVPVQYNDRYPIHFSFRGVSVSNAYATIANRPVLSGWSVPACGQIFR